MKDPIVEEVRKIKDEIAARYGYDVDRLVEALRKEQREAGRKGVTLQPRKPVR